MAGQNPSKLVLVDLTPPVAHVTLNRPEKRNALNRALLRELTLAWGQILQARAVRAVVLTGAGERAFAAGADIAELAGLDAAAAQALSKSGNDLMNGIENFAVPWIAALNGITLGGGLELALACCIRIASDTAQLGQPEVKLGLIPGYGGTQRLARLVGMARAQEMILTGEPVSAGEALRMGLVNHVVPAAELLATADALANKIAANAPLAVRWARQAVNTPSPELESSLFGLCCSTADMKEGTQAFLAKRAPAFTGT